MEETNIWVKLLLSAPVSRRASLKHGLHPSHTASQFSARFSIWSNAFCTVCRLTVRLVSCSVLFFHFSSAYNCFPWEDCTEGNVAVACIVLALFSAPNPSPHWPGMCVSGAIFWLACGNSDLYVFWLMIILEPIRMKGEALLHSAHSFGQSSNPFRLVVDFVVSLWLV